MEKQHSTENYSTKEEKIAERIANKVSEDIQNQLEKNMDKLKLKPFDIEAAKSGKPVCTRGGRKARIICFDVKGNYPMAVAVELEEDIEVIYTYPLNGRANPKEIQNNDLDLMMLLEKKEGWVNVYKEWNYPIVGIIHSSKEEAERQKDANCIATIKIEWEE